MLRLKTVMNMRKTLKRMIHPRFVKKKHLISARSTLEKTSLQEDMGRNENHGCRNPSPFQVSLSKPKKKSTTTSLVSGLNLFLQIPLTDAIKLPPYSKY